jgi:hypothetical protein
VLSAVMDVTKKSHANCLVLHSFKEIYITNGKMMYVIPFVSYLKVNVKGEDISVTGREGP